MNLINTFILIILAFFFAITLIFIKNLIIILSTKFPVIIYKRK